MTKKVAFVVSLMTLLVILPTTPVAACFECLYSSGLLLCAHTDGNGTDFCQDYTYCSGASCASWCQSSGNPCTGDGSGCAVMFDGTVICEEHRDVRTTNGEVWPEPSQTSEQTRCAA